MKWVKYILANRLLVYMITIVICLIGIFSLFFITISPFPKIAFNQVRISLSYPGANASTVQTQVTTKIENALSSIDNIQRTSAISRTGAANIELTLNSIKPNDFLQTQIKISQAIASSNLPATVPQPTIEQESGTSALVTYVLTSNKLNAFEVNNYIHSKILPKFTTIPGVSLFADDLNPTIKIALQPEKLAKYQIDLQTVSQRLNNAFQAQPLGTLQLNKQDYLLGLNQITNLNNINKFIIGYPNKASHSQNPIRLGDIATVSFAPRNIDPNYYRTFNGKPAQGVTLYTTSDANPFEVYRTTQNYLHQLTPYLPADLKFTMTDNIAKTMHASFDEVVITILVASLLILSIAMLFLGHFRSTLIPIITIPVCLLGAISIVAALGYSLNILTLLAMVIAVGLVVDDAIVIVENITRFLEQGLNKHQAIIQGTSDISFTVIGITATLLAVYLPITLFNSDTIVLYRAFAVPLAAAVFISGLVALTLTPVMCISFLPTKQQTNYQKWFNHTLKKIIDSYHYLLKHALKRPITALSLFIVLIAIGSYYDAKIPTQVFPNDPSGYIDIRIKATAEDTIVSLKKKLTQFAQFYNNPMVRDHSIKINSDQSSGLLYGYLDITLKDQYLHSAEKFTHQINQFIQKKPIKNTTANQDYFSNWGGPFDLSFALYGNITQSHLNQKAQLLTDKIKHSPIFSYSENNVVEPSKQLSFQINEPLAAKFGLYRDNISQQLGILFGGYTFNNNFTIEGLSVPIIMQLNHTSLQDPQILEKLQIYSPMSDTYYPISKFVSLKLIATPSVIATLNNQPTVNIVANLAPGHSLGEAINFVKQTTQQNMSNMNIQFFDNALRYIQGNTQTILVLILGLITIYFLLIILFKNIIDPFIIMLTVPFSVVGGAFSLYVFNGSFNIYSTLALITLIGLITKHGILIVQFANQELEKGAKKYDAILTATHHRFRPIMMTTMAMSFGALPLILNQGMMFVARRDLAMVLISGLLLGTLFSLFIVPIVYLLMKRDSHTNFKPKRLKSTAQNV